MPSGRCRAFNAFTSHCAGQAARQDQLDRSRPANHACCQVRFEDRGAFNLPECARSCWPHPPAVRPHYPDQNAGRIANELAGKRCQWVLEQGPLELHGGRVPQQYLGSCSCNASNILEDGTAWHGLTYAVQLSMAQNRPKTRFA